MHFSYVNMKCIIPVSSGQHSVCLNEIYSDGSLLECGAIGTLTHCWWEWKTMQPLWKSAWQFLKEAEQRVTI